MDVVIIPQSILAMSAPSNGSLEASHKQVGKSVLKERSKISQSRNVSRFVTEDLSSVSVDERPNNLVAFHGYETRPTFSICVGESYNFYHRHAASDLNKHYADRIASLKEVALLKTTEDCLSWLAKCKKLCSELRTVFEEQCSAKDEHQISMAASDSSKASRLLNLFERCRILVAGFKEIKGKVLFLTSAVRNQFEHQNAIKRFLVLMASTKIELLQATGNTFRMEVVLFVRYMSSFSVRQVDFGNYLSERTENLCLLFEKYGKLALLLRTLASAGYRYGRNTLHDIHLPEMPWFSTLNSHEFESGSGFHDLLCSIANFRTPSFIASAILSLDRLVQKRLLKKFIAKGGSSTSLSTSPKPETGGSPHLDSDSHIASKVSLSDKSMLQVCKRIQKRFWQELSLLCEDELMFSSALANAASSCVRNQSTVKRPNVSIVRHQHENPNGVRHLDSTWATATDFGNLKISIFAKETKRVHFSEGNAHPERKDLQEIYMRSFWQTFYDIFQVAFFLENRPGGDPTVLLRCYGDPEVSFAFLTCLSPSKHLIGKGEVSHDLMSCMASLFTKFSAMSFVQSWENCFSKMLPCSIKDRCRPVYRGVNVNPISQTASSIVSGSQSLLKLANVASKVASRSLGDKMLPLARVHAWDTQCKFLSSLAIQLQVTLAWFVTKSQQFLASGSWELFFSVVKNDLSTVISELEPFADHMSTLSESITSHCAPETYSFNLIEDINKRLDELKGLEADSIGRLITNVRERSEAVWSQAMPVSKQWRKRGVTVIPFEPNSYVELAATQVLSPLMDTMKGLDKLELEKIFCKCVRVFLQTWMSYFLEREIKFSYYGAHQLRLDLNSFRQWISKDRPHFSAEAAASALSIRLFDEFDGVISLLCCQPQSRHRGGSEGDLSVANSASSSSVSQGSFSGSANFEDIIRDVDIPNKQRWLLLRAKGSRRTRLLCLSAPE